MKDGGYRRKDGRLTRYALACGYKDRFSFMPELPSGVNLSLFMEHGFYHVRGYCGVSHVMEAFGTMAEARGFIARMIRGARLDARERARKACAAREGGWA